MTLRFEADGRRAFFFPGGCPHSTGSEALGGDSLCRLSKARAASRARAKRSMPRWEGYKGGPAVQLQKGRAPPPSKAVHKLWCTREPHRCNDDTAHA